jgi:hypothetical protein
MNQEALAEKIERPLERKRFVRVETLWEAIEVSERFGYLRERTAILLLADAYFRAKEHLKLRRNPPP